MVDVEAAPAFAFSGLEAFDQVKEGEWGGGIDLRERGEFSLENCGGIVLVAGCSGSLCNMR